MIDISRIHVVNDTFPKWLENYIEKRANTILWETRENKIDSDYTETTLSYLSYQNGYNNPPDKLELINLIHEVLSADVVPKNTSDIELTGFFGLRWNGVIKDHPPSTHRDWADASQYTIVYFVNHSDGDLVFYEDDQTTEIFRCVYKRGRAVIFPSNIYHGATAPTVSNLRITMAAQYYVEYHGHSIP
jgi:hypothetical protein